METMRDRLLERERLRQLEKSQRKVEGESDQKEFLSLFTKQSDEIKKDLDALGEDVQQEQTDSLDNLLIRITSLRKYANDFASSLPAYETRKAVSVIDELEGKWRSLKAKLVPKKKFGFKNRVPPISKVPNADQFDGILKADEASKPSEAATDFAGLGFYNRSDENLELGRHEIHLTNVNLSHLSNCKIRLLGTPASLYINNLTNCQIVVGPVTSSTLVECCDSCTLQIACKQLRIHKTKNSDFYTHVSNRTIIEDCNGLRFAPYNFSYSELESDFQTTGLDRSNNGWLQIDDFNWLATGEPSPNWTKIPSNEQIG